MERKSERNMEKSMNVENEWSDRINASKIDGAAGFELTFQ